jgi:tetratricopeptide (TPR) repeat protein
VLIDLSGVLHFTFAMNFSYLFPGFHLLLRPRCARTVAVLALTLSLVSVAPAADTPGDLLRRQFESAKASLDSGDLDLAEANFRQTIALGLRQLGNLSISEEQFERATQLLDEAVKLTPADADLQVEAAIARFRKGDAQKAAQLVQAVLAAHPENTRAHNVLGRIDLFKGDTEASVEELKKAVALQDDFETSYFLGIALLKAKKLPEAAAWFSEVQSKMGDSAALHVLFGRAYTLTHFPEPAIAEFRKAIQLDPKYPRAHGFLGYSYLEQLGEQAYPQAREEFEKELKLNPDQYYFLMLLGIATVALRDFPAAEATLRHAVRLSPGESTPYLYLGETYTETNRLALAVPALQKYVSLVQHPEDMVRDVSRAYYLLGQDLLRLGRIEEAKKALASSQRYREAKFRYDAQHIFDEKPSTTGADSRPSERIAGLLDAAAPGEDKTAESLAQGGMPANPIPASPPSGLQPPESKEARQYRAFVSEILASAYNDMGVMRAKASAFPQAAEYFKQAAVWKPDLPRLDRNWGLAAYRAELYSEAIPPLERQLAATPQDVFVRQLLGLSYYAADNFAKTADVLRPFLKNPPDDPGLLLAWGTALVRTRQPEIARDIFRRLLAQNAGNPAVHLLLGQAYAQQSDFPGALLELASALQLDPRLPEAHYFIGLIHLRQSEFESAASEFRAELEIRPADPVTSYHLGYTLLLQGQAEQAVVLLRAVVQAKPDYEMAHFELGRALLQQGDALGAIESLEAAKKLSPSRDATYFQLSQAYRHLGRLPEAQQALATYQKLIETNRLKRRESLEAEKP